MTAKPWTPQETAEFDQTIAAVNSELNQLIAALRQQFAQYGEAQGIANMGLALSLDDNRERERGLLVAALHRLATAEPDPAKTVSGGFRSHQQTHPGGDPCWCGGHHEYQ
jgi:hypothetical protein